MRAERKLTARRSSYRGSWLWGFRRYDKFSALASRSVTVDEVASLGVDGAEGKCRYLLERVCVCMCVCIMKNMYVCAYVCMYIRIAS